MSDDLAAQLRSHARLFRLGQHSAGHAQLAQLLDDAADRIEELERQLTPKGRKAIKR